jgi:hypothetical protein
VAPPAARWFLARLIFEPEDGDTFLRNVGSHTDYTVLYKEPSIISGTGAAIWSKTSFRSTGHHHLRSSPLPCVCTLPSASSERWVHVRITRRYIQKMAKFITTAVSSSDLIYVQFNDQKLQVDWIRLSLLIFFFCSFSKRKRGRSEKCVTLYMK